MSALKLDKQQAFVLFVGLAFMVQQGFIPTEAWSGPEIEKIEDLSGRMDKILLKHCPLTKGAATAIAEMMRRLATIIESE